MRRRSFGTLIARSLFAFLALAFGLGLVACGGGENEADIEERLAEKGTMEVMEEAGKAEYEPPEDGRLSERQMEDYVEVQARATKIRQVAQKQMEEASEESETEEEKGSVWSQMRNAGAAMQGFGDLMTADLRAAQELGLNAKEYQWVKVKVAEATAADYMLRMQEGMGDAHEKLLAGLEEQRENTEDANVRAALDQQIESIRESVQQADDGELDAEVRHNLELVKRFEEEISAAQEMDEEDA